MYIYIYVNIYICTKFEHIHDWTCMDLWHDNNAILYVFDFVFFVVTCTSWVLWALFFSRWCRLSMQIHICIYIYTHTLYTYTLSLHLSSRGSLFQLTPWNHFLPAWRKACGGRAPEIHWCSCCVFHDEVSAWVTMWYQEVWK